MGEHIQASSITYEDCRPFQIVCPACREPVFKVVRGEGEEQKHYLSHYAAAGAYDPECELRVASLSGSDIARADAVTRGQHLKLFLKVLRDAILTSEYDDANRPKAEAFARQFYESKGLRRYKELMFEHAFSSFKGMPLSEADEFLQDYINDVTSDGSEFPRTPYAIASQKRIAWDVWQHVLTPVAQGNYFFLLSHAALHLITRIELAAQVRTLFGYEIAIVNGLQRLLQSDRRGADLIIEQLLGTHVGPPHSLDESDAFTKMSAEMTHEAIGVLLRLPYFEILKREQRAATERAAG